MAKKKKSRGFLIGLVTGMLIATAILYYWDTYHRKSKFEREAIKLEKKAKNELNKAAEKAKKLFD
jgi:hypothetical protein